MPYKLAPNNQTIDPRTTFVGSDGLTYAPNWWETSNEADRTAAGLTWVNSPAAHDQDFYWSSGHPKDIVELKKYWIEVQKRTANRLLSVTDWLITRKAEVGSDVPAKTATYRAAVRTQCGLREETINACADTDTLCATIRNTLPQTIEGTADNGAAERFDTSKEKLDGSGNSFDPKQYESFDPKQYEDISNPALIEAWPEEE